MIAKCPKCGEFVRIPADVDPAVQVRCVLCQAEYALNEALALAPPELVLADVPIPAAADAQGETLFHAAEGPEEAESGEAPGEQEGSEAEESEEEKDEGGDSAMPPAHTANHHFRSATELTRPRRKTKSALQTLLEIVSGGVAGCLVAYYILAFWFGPRLVNEIGLPRLPLPFISQMTAPSEPGNDKPAKKKQKLSDPTTIDFPKRPTSTLVLPAETAYSKVGHFTTQPESVDQAPPQWAVLR